MAHQRIDPREYEKRRDRITELFADMMRTADEVARYRCPYKNRWDHCTARFGCRNQQAPTRAGERFLCAGDDQLDYRGAWDTQPG